MALGYYLLDVAMPHLVFGQHGALLSCVMVPPSLTIVKLRPFI